MTTLFTQEDAAIAWQREHSTHPAWCVDHEWGDGSDSGLHQSTEYKVEGLTVDICAEDDDEPQIRIRAATTASRSPPSRRPSQR